MKGTLLIIDDEPLLLKNLRRNLADLADEIITAEGGVQALKIIESQEIHCIICDINMPEMNGVDVIKALREKNYNMPFIFYTGHGHHELMKEAAKYGAFDFLDKPNLDGLEEVVTMGLKRGTSKDTTAAPDELRFLSEYNKMLKSME